MGYSKPSRNRNVREIYEKYYGPIPEFHVIHHIVPVFAGGGDEPSNLVALTCEEHAKAHWERWEKFGDFRDLCAYYMIGYNFTEAHRISASMGGKVGGKIVKERQIGICVDNPKLRAEWASMGGKVGGKTQYEKGIGIHGATKEQNREWASMGGKKGAFTNPEMQSELGKRGGVKNKGFVWVNDGERSFKYTAKMQEEKSLEAYLEENPSIKRGRIRTWKNPSGHGGFVWVNDGKRSFRYTPEMQAKKPLVEFLKENTNMSKGFIRCQKSKA